MTRCVSRPSRKATLSLICLAEASRPDLTSPAYSCPSCVPLRSPFMISSRNTFYYLTTRPGITVSTLRLPCVYPASTLRLPCVSPASPLRPALRPCLITPASRVTLRHLASASCVLCGLVVSRMFCWFLRPERVYSPPCAYLPLCSNHPLPVL